MMLKALMTSLIVKCFVSFFGYSGENKPPMFGDYEAQRHWMEITFNLPVSEWYFDTNDNNLTYWGLDYPPLTGYHSWILGFVADKIKPDFVRLNASRGYESTSHKFFMRSTVILSDLLTYSLGILLFVKFASNRLQNKTLSTRKSPLQAILYVALLYPGLILIDNGHFQYNCVSLGFALISIVALICDRDILASMFYCLSFSYKQMSLYYSFPYFVYFLGKFVKESEKSITAALTNIIKIGLTVILTILFVWFPFVTSSDQILQVLHRIFPFYRGIFEDKVANFWCVVNVIYKLKTVDNERMALLCTIVVIVSTLISCMDLLLHPEKDKFLLSLVNSSLAFFLFSFQVHEKSILLVALPVLLNSSFKPLHCFWFLWISIVSMTPLLTKDGLALPLFLLSMLYIWVVNYFYPIFDKKALVKEVTDTTKGRLVDLYYWAYLTSFIFSQLIVVFMFTFPAPKRYPDLYLLLISVFSALHFLYFLILFNFLQITLKKNKKTFLKAKKRS